MSDGTINFANRSTPPATPTTGRTKFWADSATKEPYYTDDTGSSQSLIGPAGTPGAPGADGNRWFDGSGAPAGGLGNNDDYYLDTSNGDVYLKSGGSWSIVGNIEGPFWPLCE